MDKDKVSFTLTQKRATANTEETAPTLTETLAISDIDTHAREFIIVAPTTEGTMSVVISGKESTIILYIEALLIQLKVYKEAVEASHGS